MKLSLVLCGCMAWAATATAMTPFDEAVAEILDNNATIRIATARSSAQLEQMLGENTLESPEVEFGRLWGADDVGNKWSLSVSQSFDWPGVYATRRQAVGSQRLAARLTAEAAVMDVRLEVRNALIDLIHNAQLLTVQRQLVAQLEDFVDIYRRGVEQGSETRLDLNSAVIELIGAKKELNSLQASRSSLIAALQALNGDRDVEPLVARLGEAYPIVEGVDRESISLETISQRDPSLAAAEAAVKAARDAEKIEKRLSLPGFTVGYEHETEMDEHFNGFTLGMTLPVWGRRHQRWAAAFETEAALIEAQSAVATRVAQLNADLERLTALRATLDEYEPVINSGENIALLDKALAARQINFMTYLQDLTYFLDAHKAYIDTLYEYNLTLSSLRRYN